MPTKPNLGEFVEKGGQLYFIKAENLTDGQSGKCPEARYAYLLGYGVAVILMILVLCAVVLFPIPLFALLVGAGGPMFGRRHSLL